jgi:HNH endonuclease
VTISNPWISPIRRHISPDDYEKLHEFYKAVGITACCPRFKGFDGKTHPERMTSSDWRKFRLEVARELGTHTRNEWIELRDRIGKCVFCGRSDVRLEKDHIIPIAWAGCDCIHNIQPICFSCNSRKCARIP